MNEAIRGKFIELNSAIIDSIDLIYKAQISDDRGVYKGEWTHRTDFSPSPFTVSILVDPNKEFKDSDSPQNFVKEIPYNIAYKDEYVQLRANLEEALEVIISWEDSGEFFVSLFVIRWWKKYYEEIIKALETNNWVPVEEYYLSWPEDCPFMLSIGPIETYSDSKYGVKKYFSAMLLERFNNKETHDLTTLWENCRQLTKLSDGFTQRPHFPVDARLFVGDRVKDGGEIARLKVRGWSRPQDVKLGAKHGSTKIIVNTECKNSAKSYKACSEALLKRCGVSGSILNDLLDLYEYLFNLYVLLHEYGHTYLHTPDSDVRLGLLYPPFEETRADSNTLLMVTKLENQGELPKGSTWRMILFIMSIIDFRYKFSRKQGVGSQYVFAITAIFSAVESHQALKWENGAVMVNVPELFERAGDIARESAAYYNSLVRFASLDNEVVFETYRRAKAYEKALLHALYWDEIKEDEACKLTEPERIRLELTEKAEEVSA